LSAANVTNIANTDFIGPVENTNSHALSRTLTLPQGMIKPGQNKEYYLYVWTHDDHTSSGGDIGYYPDCVVANVQTTIDSIYIKRRDNNANLFSWSGNTVTLDKQDGSGGSDSAVAKNGSAMPTISVPTRSGYVFGGYYDSTSDGIQYYTASGTSAKNWDKSSNTTLYARWVYTPVITGPSDVSMTYGEPGKTISVSVPEQTDHSYTYQWYVNSANNNTGGTAVSGATSTSYTIPAGKTAGTTEYYYCVVTATRSDSSQTATATSDVATVTVNKADTVTATVIANNRITDGAKEPLVTVDNTTIVGGEMQYALGTDTTTAPTEENAWSAEIPTATEVGTYYVWYKVVADENHTDSEPECIEVTIAEAKKEETDTSIETEVNVSEDAPAVKVDNLDEELAEELLTDAEKEAYNQGTPILVYLDVKTLAKADVPAIDLEAVEKVTKKDDYTYGECLDFSLWKKLGNAEPTKIHDTNGKPIKLTITIPDSMKSASAGYTRTFRIIRVHDGVATVIAEGTGATLEVSSDKFSSYFLVYKDTKEAVTTEATTATSTTEATTATSTTEATTAASTSDATTAASTTEAAKTSPKTGDSAPVAVMIILMSLTALGLIATKKRK